MAFIDQGEFEAMKTLSGRRAPRCDKHQFRPKNEGAWEKGPIAQILIIEKNAFKVRVHPYTSVYYQKRF